MSVIVRGAVYPVLCFLPNGSVKYRDLKGYVNVAREGEYRIVETKGLVSV